MKRAAVILAGGKSKRFQTGRDEWQNKALANLDGKPLLVHVVKNVHSVVDEVIVVANDEIQKSDYAAILSKYSLERARVITDLKFKELSGPIVAILTGLLNSDADYCLTIPADMPLLTGVVADFMFKQINGSTVVVPMWPNGRLETLLMVLERESAQKIGNVLCKLGRSRPDGFIRGAPEIFFVSPLGELKKLDPELKSFVNINSQEDLSRLQPRQGQGTVVKNIRLNTGNLPSIYLSLLEKAAFEGNKDNYREAAEIFSSCAARLEKKNLFFWAAISREYEAKSKLKAETETKDFKAVFLQAAKNYRLEAELFQKNGCYILAERANADSLWCETQAK